MIKNLILASKSPRRKEILNMLGFDVDVIPSNVDENIDIKEPAELVKKLSKIKAVSVANRHSGVVIGADTIVVKGDKIFGKPGDDAEAYKMLKELSGVTHSVFTGVTITNGKKIETFSNIAEVTMYDNSDEIIMDYIATKEPMDKAGSYGIQGKGAILVKEIRGDYFTVMGLPAAMVYRGLLNFTV